MKMNFISKLATFRSVIVLCLVLAALSITYYFLIYLPKSEKLAIEREMMFKCDDFGVKNYGKSTEDDSGYVAKRYLFSPKLNHCIMFKTENIVASPTSSPRLQLMDMARQQNIVVYDKRFPNLFNITEDEFYKEAKDYTGLDLKVY